MFAMDHRLLRPKWAKAALILLAGAAATVLSGEHLESWGFFLVALGEVALAACISAYLCRIAADLSKAAAGTVMVTKRGLPIQTRNQN
jgi:hypothetical protein